VWRCSVGTEVFYSGEWKHCNYSLGGVDEVVDILFYAMES
jgi:hypothetical protein